MLTEQEYTEWKRQYNEASASMINREAAVTKVV